MGGFVVLFSLLVRLWTPAPEGQFYGVLAFIAEPHATLIVLSLVGIAITGGMFVVPLYAFLTTTVTKDQTARTVAANNVVNSGAMVLGSVDVLALTAGGVPPVHILCLGAAMRSGKRRGGEEGGRT